MIANAALLVLFLSIFLGLAISAYQRSVIGKSTHLGIAYAWFLSLKLLGVCVLLILGLKNFWRVDVKKYRTCAYLFLLYAITISPWMIITDMGTVMGFVPFVLYLVMLYLAYRYIKKSKSLKAYFGEE